jgi:putative heme-binding domain-containing protein
MVRVHLLKALGERSNWNTGSVDTGALVRHMTEDADPFVRRAAAEALGRHPQPENLEPLFRLWKATAPDDTHLVHATRIALRDQLLAPGIYDTAAALITAQPELADRVAELSLGVRNEQSAEYLLGYLASHQVPDDQLGPYLHDTARYLAESKLADLASQLATYRDAPADRQRIVLAAARQAYDERGLPPPELLTNWAAELSVELLSGNDRNAAERGIELARLWRPAGAYDHLARLAAADAPFANLRAPAIDACAANEPARSAPLLAAILANSQDDLVVRQKAAAALAGIGSDEARRALVEQLRVAPWELAIEIARGMASSAPSAEQLLEAVKQGLASPHLLRDQAVVDRLKSAKLADTDKRVAELTAGLPAFDERLRDLIAKHRQGFLAAGDAKSADSRATAGHAIFKKVCAGCHRINSEGAKIGPELDGIGLRGLDRLLEDTLDPSRNVDQQFRATIVSTTGGQIINGLQLREEGQVLVLADATGKEVRIPIAEIESREMSRLSPMPANIADQTTEGEYYDLLAFLLSQRQEPAAGSP